MKADYTFKPTDEHYEIRDAFLDRLWRGNYTVSEIKALNDEYITKLRDVDKNVADIDLWIFLRDG